MKYFFSIIGLSFLGFALAFSQSGVGGKGGFGGKGGSGGGTTASASFPTAIVLDTFTRADENPLSDGGSWTNPAISGDSGMRLVSNQAVTAGAASNDAYWSAASFGPTVEVYVNDVAALPASGSCIGLLYRLTNPNSGTATGYITFWCNSGTPDFETWKITAGAVASQVGSSFTGAGQITTGDGFGISMVGSTITAWRKHTGTWASVTTWTDATFTTAGFTAIYAEHTAAAFSTGFGAGTGGP